MSLFARIQERLSWKLLFSYLVIVLVGVVVLAGTAELQVPGALARHAARMQAATGNNPGLAADLYEGFTTGIREVLVVAMAAATLAAIAISIFTAGRITGPLRAMTDASRRIAAGDYRQRVEVIGQDELGALARNFNRMAETLEQTESRRMELIGDVAHELRTPLASVRNTVEGLLDGVLPAQPETYLGIQSEVSRLQRLVSDLEELSRAEAGQLALDLRPANLSDLAVTAAGRLETQYEDKGVTLEFQLSANLPPVRMDSGRMIQVLTNLLGNALQYTAPGGRVLVRSWTEGQEVLASVQDSGVGISSEHLSHVFERFYRVDKSRARVGGGSGIGLTIARHLVEAHEGRIWAESPGANQGSTFTFALPYAVDDQEKKA